ncbi:RNA polymerase sigma-70 factor [Fulvivirga maritima]|uniref:RNA polymerase sigma factor n=1 Tax=Fulvivirga maritima TaxID=2904247 RepID=UPI001F25D35D|nr:RNA polymerase sigma-70 factor [Fulvivirga maritima]UII27685.1 RNA polymerase sigma-70 factor [Fulvivirga maritima]
MDNNVVNIESLKRLKNGDILAFNFVYDLYYRKVFHFAFSFSVSSEDAEEIVQDTFVKLWEKRGELDTEKSLNALLFKIAKNLALNKLKYNDSTKKRIDRYTLYQKTSCNTIEERINFKETRKVLNQAIADLPEKRRRIFTLNRIKGLTYREIAEFLNISAGTVEKQMKKALELVYQRIGNY